MTDKIEEKPRITMRDPFLPNQISKLPKGTKAQNQCDAKDKVPCKICGGWHHPRVIHLDYVGHAALTDRLLDVDPNWFWEPLALDNGLPAFDKAGGLWIKLTVNGVTRIGYGNAEIRTQMDVGSREKEVIGDALRNAAMRFGAALDLWHKGKLHADEDEDPVDTLTVAQKKQVLEDTLRYLANGDEVGLAETWHGWTADQMIVLNGMFNSEQRAAIKNMQKAGPAIAPTAKSAVPPKQGEKLSTITLDQAALLDQLIKDTESNRDVVLSYYKIASLEQLPAYLFGHAHEALRDRVKRKEAKNALKQGVSGEIVGNNAQE